MSNTKLVPNAFITGMICSTIWHYITLWVSGSNSDSTVSNGKSKYVGIEECSVLTNTHHLNYYNNNKYYDNVKFVHP